MVINILKTFLLVASIFGITAFYPLSGPSFFNGSPIEIEMDIVYQDGPCCHFGHVAAHHFAFSEPKFHQVKQITVITSKETFTWEAPADPLQRTEVNPKDQLWVFDGKHICMIRKRSFDEKKGVQCLAP